MLTVRSRNSTVLKVLSSHRNVYPFIVSFRDGEQKKKRLNKYGTKKSHLEYKTIPNALVYLRTTPLAVFWIESPLYSDIERRIRGHRQIYCHANVVFVDKTQRNIFVFESLESVKPVRLHKIRPMLLQKLLVAIMKTGQDYQLFYINGEQQDHELTCRAHSQRFLQFLDDNDIYSSFDVNRAGKSTTFIKYLSQ
jgi:hypothetical protein